MTEATLRVPVNEVELVKELYPRRRENGAAIERYCAAIDLLPPIILARGRILVDGFHRWQAHKREGLAEIAAVDLGNLTDGEILKESVRRNKDHGLQLETTDKSRMADLLYRKGTRDEAELVDLLGITPKYLEKCLREARADEKREQQEALWDRWLNCEFESYRDAGRAFGISHETAAKWIGEFSTRVDISPPDPHMAFDYWSYNKADADNSYFGAMPSGVVENLLWLWTQPGDIVVDPFAGGGTTIHVAKRMGRRVWASDRKPTNPLLPIHAHDITTGWPEQAPRKAKLILLDPPYWMQAAGRYSDDPADLANMPLPEFYESWAAVVKHCADHLDENGRLAFVVSPAQDGTLEAGRVVDLAFGMYRICEDEGLTCDRRIVVPYNTQQANGQQVDAARKHRKLLKLYRDLVVMRP